MIPQGERVSEETHRVASRVRRRWSVPPVSRAQSAPNVLSHGSSLRGPADGGFPAIVPLLAAGVVAEQRPVATGLLATHLTGLGLEYTRPGDRCVSSCIATRSVASSSLWGFPWAPIP